MAVIPYRYLHGNSACLHGRRIRNRAKICTAVLPVYMAHAIVGLDTTSIKCPLDKHLTRKFHMFPGRPK